MRKLGLSAPKSPSSQFSAPRSAKRIACSRSSLWPRGTTTSKGSSRRCTSGEIVGEGVADLGIVERDTDVEVAAAERAGDGGWHPDLRDRDGDVGVALAEGAERVDDHRGASARERPDPQAAGGEVGDRFHLELGGRDLLECRAGAVRQRAPGLRQPQRPDAAVDQRRPELTFQRRDDLRDRRLRVVEPVGGGGEGAGIADRLQDPKLLQFHSYKE